MRELVFATVVAEIKNAFAEDINDPDLIELLYRGVAEPLGITVPGVPGRYRRCSLLVHCRLRIRRTESAASARPGKYAQQ